MGDLQFWTYTISENVGPSPESYAMPFDGTLALGVRAILHTPNPDRTDKMDWLITIAAPHSLGQSATHRHPENRRTVMPAAMTVRCQPCQQVNKKP